MHIIGFILLSSGGDESCASRLVPYLSESKEDVKSLALAEMASLLQNGKALSPSY